MGRGDVSQTGESSSGSRLTRSHLQAGPVWTVQDMLILVNEVAAVEGDCQDALSSYQKWTIIAENCTALEVVRNANQCRRKWESLIADYNAVMEWESSSQANSYWSLDFIMRQETGLPVDFDKDLYNAIDDFTKVTEHADTDTECDSEEEAAEVDVLDAWTYGSKPKRVINHPTPPKNSIGRKQLALKEEHEEPVHIVKDMEQIMATNLSENINTGSKPKRVINHPTPPKNRTIGRKQLELKEEHEKPVCIFKDMEQIMATNLSENINTGPKPKRVKLQSTFQRSVTDEREQLIVEQEPEKPAPKPKTVKPQSTFQRTVPDEREQLLLEQEPEVPAPAPALAPAPAPLDMEQILATKVKEKTALIHAIISGADNTIVDDETCDMRDDEMVKTERVKCKAEKLIACLADLAKNLEQLCDVVKES
ncbi:uncharacterized protein LOC141612016 [Silene latifolia]|uniref:uncharacterized protein LOC141612016 n=1 Tax=Silene latifolia TaxID=37657 RepID=UPI003D76A820